MLIAWIFFRSDSLPEALAFVGNLLGGGWRLPDAWMAASLLFLAPLVGMHAWAWLAERARVAPLGATAKAVLAAGMTYAIVTMYAGTSDFIYFQF